MKGEWKSRWENNPHSYSQDGKIPNLTVIDDYQGNDISSAPIPVL